MAVERRIHWRWDDDRTVGVTMVGMIDAKDRFRIVRDGEWVALEDGRSPDGTDQFRVLAGFGYETVKIEAARRVQAEANEHIEEAIRRLDAVRQLLKSTGQGIEELGEVRALLRLAMVEVV